MEQRYKKNLVPDSFVANEEVCRGGVSRHRSVRISVALQSRPALSGSGCHDGLILVKWLNYNAIHWKTI